MDISLKVIVHQDRTGLYWAEVPALPETEKVSGTILGETVPDTFTFPANPNP